MYEKRIEEIKDKEEILVKGEKNCQVIHKPSSYTSGDCFDDCNTTGMPAYYVSSYY